VQLHSFSIIFHFYKEWSVFQQLLYLQSTATTLPTQPFPSGYASINYDAKHILFHTNIYNFTQQNQSSPFNYLQLTINFTTYCSQKKTQQSISGVTDENISSGGSGKNHTRLLKSPVNSTKSRTKH